MEREALRAAVLALVIFLDSGGAAASIFAYITNRGSNTVSVIDAATNTVVATIPVGTSTATPRLDPGGTRLYVTNTGDNTVSVIDTAANAVIATVGSSGSGPNGEAVKPDGTRVYVGHVGSGNVSVIDTSTNSIVASIPAGSSFYGVGIHPSGNPVYAADASANAVRVIDTSTNTVIATVPVGGFPVDSEASPNGAKVYVSNQSGASLSVISTASNTVTATIPVGSFPGGIGFTPNGLFAYVANQLSNNVSVIDVSTDSVIATVPVGALPVVASVTPDGAQVYVPNYNSNTVSVISTATNTVVATIPVGSNPYSATAGMAAAGSPAAQLTPSTLAFAPRTTGTTSPSQPVTLTNTGTATLVLASTVITGDFSYGTGCASTIAPAASCTYNVSFTPLIGGVRTGQLKFSDNAAGSPHIVSLSGTGIGAAAPTLALSASALAFPDTVIGSGSAPMVLTVSNTGAGPLVLNGVSSSSAEFDSTTCAPIPPGASCDLYPQFQPTQAGVRTATLTITSNAASSPDSVALSGQGVAAAAGTLSADPASIAFPASTAVGTASAPRTITISNSGQGPARIASVTASAHFAVQGNCTVVAAGGTCTLAAQFVPTQAGALSGSIVVASDASNSPLTVPLSGTAVAAALPRAVLGATEISFGNQIFGTSSGAMRVALTNGGLAPLLVAGISATGAFHATSDCGASLAPGANCTIQVTMVPVVAGSTAGVLRVFSNDPGGIATTALSGRGCMLPSPALLRLGVLLCGT